MKSTMHVLQRPQLLNAFCFALLIPGPGCHQPVEASIQFSLDENVLALEERAAELGLSLELGPLACLAGTEGGDEQARGELEYLSALVSALESSTGEAKPLTQTRYAVRNSAAGWPREHEFGLDSWNAADAARFREELLPTALLDLSALHAYPSFPPLLEKRGVEPIPVFWLPSVKAIDAVLATLDLDAETILANASHTGYPYALGLYFPPLPEIPAQLRDASVPMPTRGAVSYIVDPHLTIAIDPLQVGKVIAQAKGLRAASQVVDLHRSAVAECVAVEIVPGLICARWTIPGSSPQLVWSVPIADANGAARIERLNVDGGQSWFENRLEAPGLEQRFGRHSDLVVPRPRPAASDDNSVVGERSRADHVEQERIAVPAGRLVDAGGVIVLSMAPSWRPLQPDFRLSPGLDALRDDPASVLALVVSVHASTSDLLAGLALISDRRAELSDEDETRLTQLRIDLIR